MGIGRLHHRRVAVHAQEAGLVAHRPEHDAGMVVVLEDHLARDGVARLLDLALVGVAVLRPHQHALLVGQVVLHCRVGIVGEAGQVDPEVLQQRPLLAQLVVADRAQVRFRLLVLPDAAQQDGGAVEGEALAVEAEVAEAEALLHAVGRAAVHQGLRVHGVEAGVGGAPELRPGHVRGGDDLAARARLHADRAFEGRDLGAARIAHAAAHPHLARAGRGVAHEGADGEVGPLRGHVRGRDVDAGRGMVRGVDVHRVRLEQPGLAVDPAIEVVELLARAGRQRVGGGEELVVRADGQDVLAVHDVVGRVEDEARERAAMLAEMVPVEVDVGKDGHAFEDDVDATARFGPRDGKTQAIPRALERLRAPGVRDLDGRPIVIVESRCLGPGEVLAAVEAPRTRQEDAGPEVGR